VQPKDVLEALGELEFEGFVGRVEAELLSKCGRRIAIGRRKQV